jgi:hypothetical protein
MDSNLTCVGPPTWLGCSCLASKEVAKEEMSFVISKVLSISLGHAPTWARVPRVNIKPTTTIRLSAETTSTCHNGLEALVT